MMISPDSCLLILAFGRRCVRFREKVVPSSMQYQFQLSTIVHNRQSNGFKQRAQAFSCLWGVPCVDSATESILVCLQCLPIRSCEAHPDCGLVAVVCRQHLWQGALTGQHVVLCVCVFLCVCDTVCHPYINCRIRHQDVYVWVFWILGVYLLSSCCLFQCQIVSHHCSWPVSPDIGHLHSCQDWGWKGTCELLTTTSSASKSCFMINT